MHLLVPVALHEQSPGGRWPISGGLGQGRQAGWRPGSLDAGASGSYIVESRYLYPVCRVRNPCRLLGGRRL